MDFVSIPSTQAASVFMIRRVTPILLAIGISVPLCLLSFPLFAADGESPEQTPGAPAMENLQQALQQVRTLFEGGSWGDAERILDRLARTHPDNTQVRYWLGLAYLRQEKLEQGVAQLEKAAGMAPDDQRLKTELARAYRMAGRAEGARRLLEEVISEAADDLREEAGLELGELHAEDGRLDEAVQVLEQVVKMSSSSEQAKEARQRLEGLYGRLAASVTQALQVGEGDADSAMALARKLLKKNDLDEAQKILVVYQERFPDDPQGYYWLGQIFMKKREFSAAIDQMEKSVSVAPDNMRLRMQLARAYERIARHGEAKRVYEEIISGAENEQLVQAAEKRLGMMEAQALTTQGKHEEAAEIYSTLAERFPGDLRILSLLANSYQRLGREDEVMQVVEKALEVDSDNIALRFWLADRYRKNGQDDLADKHYLAIVERSERDSGDYRQALRKLGLEEGYKLAQQLKYDAALEKFRRVLDVVPDQPEANYYVGVILQKQGKYEAAVKALQKAIRINRGNLKARMKLGLVYSEMGRFDEAVEVYEQIISEGGDEGAVREARARLGRMVEDMANAGRNLLREEDLDGAQKIYETLISQQPDDPRWYYWLGQVHKKRGEQDKVVELLEKSSSLAPGNIRLMKSLGDAYIDAGMLDDAEQAFLKILEITPYHAETRLSLARIYEMQGESRRADQQVGRLLELEPIASLRQEALGLIGLEKGQEYLKKGKLDEAQEAFERVLSVVPDDPLANTLLGDLYAARKDYDAAEQAYLKAASPEYPKQAGVLLKLADVYREAGRDDDAIRVLNEILVRHESTKEAQEARKKLQPILAGRADALLNEAGEDLENQTERLIGEGVVMLELNGLDGAKKIFSRIVKRQPDNARALYWLGQVFDRKKDYSTAITLLKKSVELVPDNLVYREALARAYFKAEKYQQVVEHLAPVLDAQPDDPELHMMAGETYRRIGLKEEAEQHFARVIALDPGSERAAAALDHLGFGKGRMMARQGLLDQALEAFRHILEIVPGEPEVNFEAGKVYLKQKRFTDAREALQKVLQVAPEHSGAHLWLGQLDVEVGRLDEAIGHYERVVALSGNSLQSQEVRRTLQGLYRHHAEELVKELLVSSAKIDMALPFVKKLIQKGELDSAQRILETLLVRRPDDAQANYWLGQIHVRRGQNDTAEKYLRRSVSLAPDNMQLRFELGKFYDRIGNLDAAKQVYERIISASSSKDLVRQARKRLALAWGRDYTEQGDFHAALAEYQALQKTYPDDTIVMGLIGWSYLRMGETRKADEIFEKMLELASDDVEINMRMAEVYARRGDLKRYKELLVKVARLDPDGRRGREALDALGYREGVELLENGELEAALGVFQRILADVPDAPLLNFQAGVIYQQQGRLLEAEAAFRKVLAVKPDHLEAGMKLAQVYFDLTQESKAIDALEQVASAGRDTKLGKEAVAKLSTLYKRRAERLSKAGETEFAIREYKALLKYDPDNAAAHYNLALLYTNVNRMDDALAEFRIVTRLAPDNSGTYLNIARIYNQQQRFGLAAEAYAYAVSLTPDPEKARKEARKLGVALARQLLKEDRPGAALKVLEGFRDQNDPQINYYLGVVYRQQGDMESAVAAFRDAVELSGTNVALRYNLAILYQRINEDQLALNQYREILKRGKPGDVYVERARRNITAVENRLRRFTSNLRYDTSVGDTTVSDEVREVETSSFISTLNYNLATRFRPRKNIVLTLDTGFSYATNHSNESDSMRPRLGLRANINHPDKYFLANATYSESHGLLLDTFAGRGISLSMVGGLRLEDPVAYLKKLFHVGEENRRRDQSETRIERSPEQQAEEQRDEMDVAALRRDLDAAYQEIIPDKKERPIPVEEEEVKQYIVRKGDTLWDISEALLLDPFLWPEIWQTNPDIENPHLIFPGDVITLFYIGGVPVLRIEREGELISLPPELVALTPEEMARRAGQIRENIDRDIADFNRASSMLEQGRFGEAIPLLERLHELVPDNSSINLMLGRAYLNVGQFVEAEQSLRKVLETDPDHIEARMLLSDLYTRVDRIDDAIAVLQEVMELAAGTPRAEEAAQRLREVLQRRAMAVLEEPELTDEDIAAVIEDGMHLMSMSDLDGARQVFHALLTRFPENGEGYFWLARINLEEGNDDVAIAYLEQALAYQPGNMEARFLLAGLYQSQMRLRDAEEAYRAIVDLSASEELVERARHEIALMNAARFEEVGDFATALSLYMDMLEDYPQDADLLARIARVHEMLGQPDLALEYYQKAIAADPGNIEARFSLAALYAQQKMHRNSREQLAAIMAMDPDEATRQRVLESLGLKKALALMAENRLDDALELFENVLEVVPDEPLARLNIGIIYMLQGRYNEAEAQFVSILEDDPRNLSARYRLGLLYAETGRLNKAIEVLEQVAREGGDTEAGAQAALKLKELEAERLRSLTIPQLKKAEPQPKVFQAGMTFNDFNPENVTLTETRTWGVNLLATYPTIRWGNWGLLYDYTNTDNEQPLGTDYAYTAHQIRLTYNRPVPKVPRLFGSASLGWQNQLYSYPDTNARFALGVEEERRNVRISASFNLSYRAHDDMTLFAGYSYSDTSSNLPVGFVYAPNGVPVAFQSVSLGDFSSSYFNLGLQFRF